MNSLLAVIVAVAVTMKIFMHGPRQGWVYTPPEHRASQPIPSSKFGDYSTIAETHINLQDVESPETVYKILEGQINGPEALILDEKNDVLYSGRQ